MTGDREQFWQTHVDACRVSGVSQKTYCERHGITPKTFRKWRSRLAGTAHVVAADGEPHGGEAKGGAREFFSSSFGDPSNRAQLVDLLTNPRFRRTWTPEQRRQIVIDALRSGLSIERFARMSGLTPSVVYRWREELAARVRHGHDLLPHDPPQHSAAAPTFASVHVAPGFSEPVPRVASNAPDALARDTVEVILTNGRRVRVHADDTTLPALDPGRGKTKTGRLWAYTRDDRTWGGPGHPAVVFHYAPGRTAARPAEHLAGFRGILQVDGYAGFEHLAADGAVTLAACWAHARRRFYELHQAGSPVAGEALQRIAVLYQIEAGIRGQPPTGRQRVRSQQSRPLVEALKLWLELKLAHLPGRSRLAEAIRYALNRWPGLSRFLDDGRIDLDTNPVERSIRPVALGRRNSLFAGSDGGARRWAVVGSLVETCKLNGVEPFAWLRDVLTRMIDGHSNQHLDDLLPWRLG